MKQRHFLFAFLVFGLAMVTATTGCLRDKCTSKQVFTRFDPIIKTGADFRKDIAAEGPRALKNPGKIYAYGTYLFINERNEGIHVVDNSNPADPRTIAFWNIPGNVDIAIRGNYLYADQYVDLLTIDISNYEQPHVVCRQEESFWLHGRTADGSYVVGYTTTDITQELDCTDSRAEQTWFIEGDVVFIKDFSNTGSFDGNASQSGSNSSAQAAGVAGSYARFGLINDYLYTLDPSILRTWSLANPVCPTKIDSTWTAGNAETLFPWKDRLFVGSPTGLQIFNNTDPAHPVYESMFSHATGCDPVVCDENNAYVTIHSGTGCGGTFNQLDIVDIRNLPIANTVKSYPMTSPLGLAVTDEHLFVCDDGLKIYDKSDPLNLDLKKHYKNLKTYDVIAFTEDHLMVVGDSGFYQFDVSNPSDPKQISLIPVVK